MSLEDLLPELLTLPSDELGTAVLAIRSELSSRMLREGDLTAVTEEAFSTMFASDGLPTDPVLRSGMLVCAGGKVDRSAMSHRCRFVRVSGGWVWENQEVLSDVVRHAQGPRRSMRSVTLVPALPGDEVDVVSCRTRNAVHELVSVRSFVVGVDELTLVSSRAVGRTDHR